MPLSLFAPMKIGPPTVPASVTFTVCFQTRVVGSATTTHTRKSIQLDLNNTIGEMNKVYRLVEGYPALKRG